MPTVRLDENGFLRGTDVLGLENVSDSFRVIGTILTEPYEFPSSDGARESISSHVITYDLRRLLRFRSSIVADEINKKIDSIEISKR